MNPSGWGPRGRSWLVPNGPLYESYQLIARIVTAERSAMFVLSVLKSWLYKNDFRQDIAALIYSLWLQTACLRWPFSVTLSHHHESSPLRNLDTRPQQTVSKVQWTESRTFSGNRGARLIFTAKNRTRTIISCWHGELLHWQAVQVHRLTG
jgi:hypothetical protein